MIHFTRLLLILGLVILSNVGLSQGIIFVQDMTYNQALEKAKAENKMLLVNFYTTWCNPCKQVEKYIFSQSRVGDIVNKDFISIKIDAERGEGIALASRFTISGYPTYIFMNGDDTEKCRLRGAPNNATCFLEIVNMAKGKNVDLAEIYLKYQAATTNKLELAQEILHIAPAHYAIMNGITQREWMLRAKELSEYYFKTKRIEDMINNKDFDIISTFLSYLDNSDSKIQFIYNNYDKFKAVVSNEYDLASFCVKMNNRSIQKYSTEGDLIWKKYVSYIGDELKQAYLFLGEKQAKNTMDYVAKINMAIRENDIDRYISLRDKYIQLLRDNGNMQDGEYLYAAQTLIHQFKVELNEKQVLKGINWLESNIKTNFNTPYSYMLIGDLYSTLPNKKKEAITNYNKCMMEAKKINDNSYKYYAPKLQEKIKNLKDKK